MTDTPYGWIDELERAASNLERAATRAAKDALRARITAGDAAIKRVAELEGDNLVILTGREDLRAMWERAEAALAAMRKGGVPQSVWIVSNKTFAAAFATKDAADSFVSSQPASMSGEMSVTETPLLAAAPQPPATTE